MFNKFILTDIKTGTKSYTTSIFVYGFLIVSFKLVFSGITIGGLRISEFSGVDFGASLAGLASCYVLRKNSSQSPDPVQTKEDTCK